MKGKTLLICSSKTTFFNSKNRIAKITTQRIIKAKEASRSKQSTVEIQVEIQEEIEVQLEIQQEEEEKQTERIVSESISLFPSQEEEEVLLSTNCPSSGKGQTAAHQGSGPGSSRPPHPRPQRESKAKIQCSSDELIRGIFQSLGRRRGPAFRL